MGKIKLLIKYFVYRIRRRGVKGHGIHSPFVFELNRNVLNSGENYREYQNIGDYRRSLSGNREMINVYDKGAGSLVFSSDKRVIKDILKYTASSCRTGRLLFRLARYFKPRNIIELGTSLGFGAMCLATGSAMGTVYSLEACPRQLEIAGAELERAGAGNVELIKGDFRDMLPELLNSIEQVDLVYFDGDHSTGSLIWQFRTCLEKADPSSVFVVGDIHWSDEMDLAWEILCNDPVVTLSVDLFYCGLLFFRKGMAKQHHLLTYSD